MRALLAVVFVMASAQAPLIEPCGGVASCVRVGIPDGGQVQLGGVLQSSAYATPDGGVRQIRLQPLTSNIPVAVLGNQSNTSGDPDVILGGTTARDGGFALVRFVSGGYTIGSLTSNGVLTVNGLTNAGTSTIGTQKVDILDAGVARVNGQLQTLGPNLLGGVTTAHVLDAGTGSKVGGRTIGVIQAQDGGEATAMCQFFQTALSNGDAGVTYRTAFSAIPTCTCAHVATTNANPCVITTAPSATAVGLSAQSAGTDVVNAICCGDL